MSKKRLISALTAWADGADSCTADTSLGWLEEATGLIRQPDKMDVSDLPTAPREPAMKVYAILVQDRHCDPELKVYTDRQRAIDSARAIAKEYDRHGDYEERQVADWVFHAVYSCEGDSVTVLECEVL